MENPRKNFLIKRVLKSTSNYGLGTVLPKVIGFLLIPIYTAYLTPKDYGIVDLCTSITLLLLMIFKLGIPGSVSRFYLDHKDDIKTYISTMFWFLVVLGTFFLIITMILGRVFFNKFFLDISFSPFFILMSMTAFLQIFGTMQRQIIIIREESQYSAKLSIITALITILIILILVVGFDMKALGYVWGSLAGAFFVFIQFLFYLRNDLKLRFKWSLLSPSIIWGISIFPSHLINHFSPIISKMLLVNSYDLSALGVVSIAVRFTSPLFISVTAFKNSYLPIYYSFRKDGTKKAHKNLIEIERKIWILSCILFLFSVLINPAIIKIVTPLVYHNASKLIWILSIGFLFNVIWILFGLEIFYSKKTYLHSILSFLAISLNLIFVYMFIEPIGEYAIVFGMTIFWIVFGLVGSFFAKKIFSYSKDYTFYLKSSIITSFLTSFHWIFQFYQLNNYVIIFLSSFIIFVFYLFYEKNLGFSVRSFFV